MLLYNPNVCVYLDFVFKFLFFSLFLSLSPRLLLYAYIKVPRNELLLLFISIESFFPFCSFTLFTFVETFFWHSISTYTIVGEYLPRTIFAAPIHCTFPGITFIFPISTAIHANIIVNKFTVISSQFSVLNFVEYFLFAFFPLGAEEQFFLFLLKTHFFTPNSVRTFSLFSLYFSFKMIRRRKKAHKEMPTVQSIFFKEISSLHAIYIDLLILCWFFEKYEMKSTI